MIEIFRIWRSDIEDKIGIYEFGECNISNIGYTYGDQGLIKTDVKDVEFNTFMKDNKDTYLFENDIIIDELQTYFVILRKSNGLYIAKTIHGIEIELEVLAKTSYIVREGTIHDEELLRLFKGSYDE